MGDELINLSQEKILKLLAEQWKGLTIDEIRQYSTERKLGLPGNDLDTILEEMESLRFLRSENGERTKWYITMKGLCAVGESPDDMWP
jgi:DNA-binding IclR family transcriptional regulator